MQGGLGLTETVLALDLRPGLLRATPSGKVETNSNKDEL